MPIGLWVVDYSIIMYTYKTTATEIAMQATMSTANNSESNAALTSVVYIAGASSTLSIQSQVYKRVLVAAASKTLYYFNGRSAIASAATIAFQNANGAMVVNFLCAYL
jgi:hypothetical protein